MSLVYNIMNYKTQFSEQSFSPELTAGGKRPDLAGT